MTLVVSFDHVTGVAGAEVKLWVHDFSDPTSPTMVDNHVFSLADTFPSPVGVWPAEDSILGTQASNITVGTGRYQAYSYTSDTIATDGNVQSDYDVMQDAARTQTTGIAAFSGEFLNTNNIGIVLLDGTDSSAPTVLDTVTLLSSNQGFNPRICFDQTDNDETLYTLYQDTSGTNTNKVRTYDVSGNTFSAVGSDLNLGVYRSTAGITVVRSGVLAICWNFQPTCLGVIDCSTPGSLSLDGTAGAPATGGGTKKGPWRWDDNTVIISDRTNGLLAFDVTTPSSPSRVDELAGVDATSMVKLDDTYAVFGGETSPDLYVVDLSDPTSMVLDNTYALDNSAVWVDSQGFVESALVTGFALGLRF